MNVIYILLNEIKKLIKYNTVTFVVVSVSMILSTFGILFYAGYISYGYDDESRYQILEIEFRKNANEKNIKDIYKELLNNEVVHVVVAENKKKYEDENMICLVGEYDRAYENDRAAGQVFALDSKDDGIVVCEDVLEEDILSKGNPIKQDIKIQEHEYTIKGIVLYMDYLNYATSVNYYLNHGEVGYMKVIFRNALSKTETEHLTKIVNGSEVSAYRITNPKPLISNLDFWMEFGQILLIFCIVIVNLFMIIAYWVNQQKQNYNIYLLCGAKESTVTLFMFLKVFLILFVDIAVGLGLFMIIKNSMVDLGLVSNQNIFYMEIAVWIMVIVSLFALITIRKVNGRKQIYYVKE